MENKIFLVEGMKCKNCAAHVERELKKLEGIETVDADFANGLVAVAGEVPNDDRIQAAIEKAGYRFRGGSPS